MASYYSTCATLLHTILATCLSNKLTYLIYDGVEKLIEEQAKTLIEGSSAANMTRHDWKGTRKEDNRTEKKAKVNIIALL